MAASLDLGGWIDVKLLVARDGAGQGIRRSAPSPLAPSLQQDDRRYSSKSGDFWGEEVGETGGHSPCHPSSTRSSATAENSASAAHMEGAKPSSPLPLPLWLHLCVRSNPKPATKVRQACQKLESVKRTLSWIGHSRSFKVILICADRNPERCIVVMSN